MSPVCLLCGESKTSPYTLKNQCSLYKCTSCALMFVSPLPDTSSVYSESYFAGAGEGFGYVDYDRDKEPMVPAFMKYLQLIRTHLPGAKRLLDVGAATGFFIGIANKEGFTAEGVEISPYAAEIGRKKGIPVTTGTIAALVDAGTEQYDVITMLDVIEHVPNPEQDIKDAGALLNPGGLLVINTPDTGSVYAKVMGTRWHLITPPEHLVYFNRKNLAELLKRNGFETVWVGTIGKQFTLPYIFRTLHAWQGIGMWDTLARWTERSPLAKLSLPINLGDNLFLIARTHGT